MLNDTEMQSLISLLKFALSDVEVIRERPRLAPVDFHQYKAILVEAESRHISEDAESFLRNAKPRLKNEETKINLTQTIEHYLGDRISNGYTLPASFAYLGGDGKGYSIDDLLTQWLAIAIAKGADFAAKSFVECIDGTPVKLQLMTLLKGISISREIEIDSGIRLMPMPDQEWDLPNYLPRLLMRGSPHPWDFINSVVLIIEHEIRPVFVDPELINTCPFDLLVGDKGPFSGGAVSDKYPNFAVQRFCSALSLVVGSLVIPTVSWTHAGRNHLWHINSVSSYSYYDGPSRAGGAHVDEAHIRETMRLYDAHESLGQGVSKWLEVPISRWEKAVGGRNFTDQFIDLGIALESFYVDNRASEIRFRLSQYGAWYLGNDADDRKNIARDLRHIYDQRSNAAHGGMVTEDEKTTLLQEKARELCRQSIIKAIGEGNKPIWDDLIVGL